MISKLNVRAKYCWRQHIRPFLFVVLVLTAFRSAVADWNDVPSGSMKPTILEGDRIFVNKLAYDLKVPYTTWHLATWGDPQRGDIVIFYSPADGKRLVKRVVGLPGDTVQMTNDSLAINGVAAQYPSIDPAVQAQLSPSQRSGRWLFDESLAGRRHPVMITPGARALRSFGPVRVPAGHFFMMGDNRDDSLDSRFFGPVPRQAIVGRASRVVVSLNVDDYYQPRWNRFLRPLP